MKLHEQDVLRQAAVVLAPLIVVFGVYVITHGEGGPGGGFQGGVIVAAAYILYALIFGQEVARQAIPRGWTDTCAALGVLIYAGVGAVGMLRGGEFLSYDLLDPRFVAGQAGHSPHYQAWGMTLVELGVGLTVASVMVTVFSEMVEE